MSISDLTYNGNVTYQIVSNITTEITGDFTRPPFPATANGQDVGTFVNISGVFGEAIQWDVGAPAYLQGLSINSINDQLGDTIPGTFGGSMVFTVTSGAQFVNCGAQANIYVAFLGLDKTPLASPINLSALDVGGGQEPIRQFCFPNDTTCPSEQIPLNKDITYVQILSWNSTCLNFTATNFTLEMDIKVALNISCQPTTKDLATTGFCTSYCIANATPTSYEDCAQSYIDYCFQNDNIKNVLECQTFLKGYAEPEEANGVDNVSPTLYSNLNTYCQGKFGSPTGGGLQQLSQADQTDQNICGCSLRQQQYDNFAQSLLNNTTGQPTPTTPTGGPSTTFGIDAPCLVSYCANGWFKPDRKCDVPACLVVSDFNNSGTFNNSSITVKKSIKGCANVNKTSNTSTTNSSSSSGGGGGTAAKSGGATTQSFLEKYKWWFLGGGVVLVMLLLIVTFVLIIK